MSEQKHHLLPRFQESEVLFGHDGTTGLIACEIAGNDSVKLFARDGAATKIDTVSFNRSCCWKAMRRWRVGMKNFGHGSMARRKKSRRQNWQFRRPIEHWLLNSDFLFSGLF